MHRRRRPFLIVLLVTILLVMRGIVPAQAGQGAHVHDDCAAMSARSHAQDFRSRDSAMHSVVLHQARAIPGHMASPVHPGHVSTHDHECTSCLPSMTCVAGFALPAAQQSEQGRAIMAACYALPRAYLLTGHRAAPDPRPPRAFLNI